MLSAGSSESRATLDALEGCPRRARTSSPSRAREKLSNRTRSQSAHQQQEELVIKKSRLVVSIGMVVALIGSTLALADGASTNDAQVDGSISPTKLDKKKYKPISLFSGVRTTVPGGVTGTQSNPVVEYI